MIRIDLPPVQEPPLPAFEATATLDGTTYTLRFQWSESESSWYVRVMDDVALTIKMADVRVGADWPLYLSRTARTPPGLLVVVDTAGRKQDPGLADLGARCRLYYLPKDELPEGL